MLFSYLEAVVIKHWLPVLVGILGSMPWWGRALLSEALKKKCDAVFRPGPLRVLAIICICVTFVWANYSAWLDERRQIIKLQEKKPDLKATDFGFFAGTNVIIRNEKGCMTVLHATIANIGSLPTSATDFEVSVSDSKREIKGIPLVMPARLNLNVSGGQPGATFTREDYLIFKCSDLIFTGRPVFGVQGFFFPKLEKADLFNENLIIRLRFKDGFNNNYVFERHNEPHLGILGPLRMEEMHELP